MIWFFTRRGEHIRVETRLREDADGFELVIIEPGRCERFEYFLDERRLVERRQQICHELFRSGWDAPVSRQV